MHKQTGSPVATQHCTTDFNFGHDGNIKGDKNCGDDAGQIKGMTDGGTA